MISVVGIMSGTSLDGIDICHVNFTELGYEIKNYIEVEYEPLIKMKIKKAINQQLTLSQLTSLDYELGYEYARAIKLALKRWDTSASKIDVIANHGQTIYHNDNKPGTVNSTLQLGCGDIIKQQLNVDVVTNFRSADIAVGNKGAPLVQIFDQYLIEKQSLCNAIFLNIGGISNVYIDAVNKSFDTGPGNMMINYAISKLYDLDYDQDGKIAASGCVNEDMLQELLEHRFFSDENQLSTGREDFGDEYVDQILHKYDSLLNEDIICTLTKFTADSIAQELLKRTIDSKGIIYVSGGGAYNTAILKFLDSNFKNLKVQLINDLGITATQKEAVAFAYLGYMNYSNKKVKTLNGSKTILGVLHKRG